MAARTRKIARPKPSASRDTAVLEQTLRAERPPRAELAPFKQPDLEWYFETAATPDSNRAAVRQLIAQAPAEARALFRIAEERGKTVWWWQRLTLIAEKR